MTTGATTTCSQQAFGALSLVVARCECKIEHVRFGFLNKKVWKMDRFCLGCCCRSWNLKIDTGAKLGVVKKNKLDAVYQRAKRLITQVRDAMELRVGV